MFRQSGAQLISQGSSVTTYVYNAEGKLAKLEAKQGSYTYYDEIEYDASGRLAKITSFDGEETITLEYTYHENGKLASMTQTTGDNTEPDYVESYYENGLPKKYESDDYCAEYLYSDVDYRFQRGYVRSSTEFSEYSTYAKEIYEEYTIEWFSEYDEDLLLVKTEEITYENGKKIYKEVYEYTWHENRKQKTMKRTTYNYDENGIASFGGELTYEYDEDGNQIG